MNKNIDDPNVLKEMNFKELRSLVWNYRVKEFLNSKGKNWTRMGTIELRSNLITYHYEQIKQKAQRIEYEESYKRNGKMWVLNNLKNIEHHLNNLIEIIHTDYKKELEECLVFIKGMYSKNKTKKY